MILKGKIVFKSLRKFQSFVCLRGHASSEQIEPFSKRKLKQRNDILQHCRGLRLKRFIKTIFIFIFRYVCNFN
jgi:hypothetical protein